MRIGLIAALLPAETGGLRAELPLAGRSVLGWQVSLLQSLGAERVLCLCTSATSEVLRYQHVVEVGGAAFHALNSFAALPALVRAEDDLIILHDGLVPDPALVCELVGDDLAARRLISTIAADHSLVADHPMDFERIDAGRHWAGFTVMRGAAVQQLVDFPADADAVSVLLRLALQAGTPCHDFASGDLVPDRWLLAQSLPTVTRHEQVLVAQAAPRIDWRAPLTALAHTLVRRLAPRGLTQGARIGAGLALAAMVAAVASAAFGSASSAMALAATGAFAARISSAYAILAARLQGLANAGAQRRALGWAVDILAGLALWSALAPWPQWTPLAVGGPVALGLARLLAQGRDDGLAALTDDRIALFLLLAISAAFGVLAEAVAFLLLALLTALLVRGRSD